VCVRRLENPISLLREYFQNFEREYAHGAKQQGNGKSVLSPIRSLQKGEEKYLQNLCQVAPKD
jgi:hypothetical protein